MISCKNTKETLIACRMLSLTGYLSRTLYIQYWFSTHFALALNPSNESWDHHCAVSSPFLLNFLPRTNKLDNKPSFDKKGRLRRRKKRSAGETHPKHSPTLLRTAFVPIWSTAEISQDLAKGGGWKKCSILRVDRKVQHPKGLRWNRWRAFGLAFSM